MNLFLTLLFTSPSYYLKNKSRCTPMCLKGAATLVPCCFVCMVCDQPSAGFQFPLYPMHLGIIRKLGKLHPPQGLNRDCASHSSLIYAFNRLHKPNSVGLEQHLRPRVSHETMENTVWIQKAAFLTTGKGIN